jgi:hypothetical protein
VLSILWFAHVLAGEPASTSPEHVLARSEALEKKNPDVAMRHPG